MPHRVQTRTYLLISATSIILSVVIFVIFTKHVAKWEMSPMAATKSAFTDQLQLSVNDKVNMDFTAKIHQLVDRKSNKTCDITMHTYINIFNASDENEEERNSINKNRCVTLRTTKGNTPICIYDPRIDKFVSGSIVSSGMWDAVGVRFMASLLSEHPDMQLLDIGSNIGVFTLQAAKMGRKVIAVDANKFNLRLLAKSLRLGELQKYVTLVWNAITDIHETVNLTIITGNIGGSFTKSFGEPIPPDKAKFNKQPAVAITLEDLVGFLKGNPVFIKIDIERAEWKAFRGGEVFFQEVDVRYVLMEWWTYKKETNGPEVVMFMTRFGFYPYPVRWPVKNKLNVDTYKTWPGDVLWMKN